MAASQSKGVVYAAELIECIKAVREEHHACTAREVARRMQVTHTLMSRQLQILLANGLIELTGMPGSICVTAKGGKFRSGVRAGKITGNLPDPARQPLPGEMEHPVLVAE